MEDDTLGLGETLSFKDGETIYEEGQDAKGAYLVIDGQVDLWRHINGAFNFLAVIERGNIFGEASVFRREPRSTTARAKGKTRVLFIEADNFRRSFADPLVKHVTLSMAARLRERYVPARELIQDSNIILAQRRKPMKKKHTGEPLIEGVTPLVIDVMVGRVRVEQFPFTVGNTRVYGEMARLNDQSLMLPLPTASDLDSQHFELIKRGDDILVRDLGSRYGTVVNGEKVSKHEKKNELALEVGENIVGTGGLNSKVTFLVTLPELSG